MKKLRVCVIIPAFNESQVIAKVVSDLISKTKNLPHDITVVVIDDHSTDDTAHQARQIGVKVIRHVLNTGAGGATATGLEFARAAGFDIAATMDADGQHLSEDVIRGIDELIKKDVDLLIGSRLINSQGMSKSKIVGNKGLSFITNTLFGIDSTDSQSGLRIFSRKAIEKLRWRSSGYEFCSEMLWRAKQAKLKYAEYPIKAVYTDYSVSKGQNNWNAVNIIKSLLKRRIGDIFK